MSSPEVPLYKPVPGGEPTATWSWTARFRLPEVLPRSVVLAEIQRGTQAMKYSADIPLDTIDALGLSGALVGPDGDDDANEVQDVIFATDPSRRFGIRPSHHSDRHAVRLAEVNHWTEVEQDGSEIPLDAEVVGVRGLVRAINGRNKDRYNGDEAFTYNEARRMLLPNTRFTTEGGHLFSIRPTWKKPYSEPAIILSMPDTQYDLAAEHELFELNKRLNWQHRFVLESPEGTEVFQANEDHPDFPPELRST